MTLRSVEDMGDISAEGNAACPQEVMWTESDKTHPMTSRVDDNDVDKKWVKGGEYMRIYSCIGGLHTARHPCWVAISGLSLSRPYSRAMSQLQCTSVNGLKLWLLG